MDVSAPDPPRHATRARRPRAARACDLCRTKKNKCDELSPCTYCKNRNTRCVYQGQPAGSGRIAADYVKQLEDQVTQLTTQLNQRPAVPAPHVGIDIGHGSGALLQQGTSPSANNVYSQHARDADVSGVNRHTRDVEFYGSSSSVALLSHVQHSDRETRDEDGGHLVSSLHNPAFRTTSSTGPTQNLSPEVLVGHAHHYPQFRVLLENFFSSIHYIHPILDKTEFFIKCETLWSGSIDSANDDSMSSFVALYYSVLSLGALVGIRNGDINEHMCGLNNLEWSRRFFDIARTHCNQLGLITDLEMVQCYFIMAKVCQNELNPHLSYMYIGLAVRTALAIGANRDAGATSKKSVSQLKAESRTWWGLYSLETEIAFSIGRPDTLGADAYHNRKFPLVQDLDHHQAADDPMLEPPYCAIISCMVDFSKITKSICQYVYLSNDSLSDLMMTIYNIEEKLNNWLGRLPDSIRPPIQQHSGQRSSLRRARDAQWIKRQRLVLGIRYHNLRILLFGSLLLRLSQTEDLNVPGHKDNVLKCLDSAKETIDIIYYIYEHSDFFQTWFYNTTYTVFAASVILLYVTKVPLNREESQACLQYVEKAIEILEIMDECVAALEAAKLLRRAKDKAESRSLMTSIPLQEEAFSSNAIPDPNLMSPLLTPVDGESYQLSNYWGPLGFIDGSGMDFDITFQF